MRKTLTLASAFLLALTMAPAADADTAQHNQDCDTKDVTDANNVTTTHEVCLANEVWNGGFRAFETLLNDPMGTSLPMFLGATSVLIDPVCSGPGNSPYDPCEKLRDRFRSDGTQVNVDNYGDYDPTNGSTCDPVTSFNSDHDGDPATPGIIVGTHSISYRATWTDSTALGWYGVNGEMRYSTANPGFWFTNTTWIDAFSPTEFHYITGPLVENTGNETVPVWTPSGHNCDVTIGTSTVNTFDMSGLQPRDHTVYRP